MKKRFKKIVKVLLIIFTCFIVLKIIRFQFNKITDIKIKDGAIISQLPFEREDKLNEDIPVFSSEIENNESNELKDTKIFINGKIIDSKDKFYEYKRRYYISLDSIEEYNIKLTDEISTNLRGEIINLNEKKYISINDVENILNCKSNWDAESKEIYIYNKEENLPKVSNLSSKDNSKVALIRLEDVSCSGEESEAESINKYKIMIDMLKTNNIKFHLAWIPRYIAPDSGIDNDLTKENTFVNCDFINLLDYIINNGGEIGLHGYTHQFGDSTSGAGSELTIFDNREESEVRAVVKNAINTANYLKIPYKFFESPHYHATRSQQKILEEYFDILFEPYAGYWNLRPIISLSDKSTIYMPTCLGYVKDEDGSEMVHKINNRWSTEACAMFFHPYKELAYIEITGNEDGKIEFKYKEGSPLSNILNALNNNNYTTIHVSEINKKFIIDN